MAGEGFSRYARCRRVEDKERKTAPQVGGSGIGDTNHIPDESTCITEPSTGKKFGVCCQSPSQMAFLRCC